MATYASETYRSSIPVEAQTKETEISDAAVIPETIKGEDWPGPRIEGLNPTFMDVPGPDAYLIIHGSGYTEEAVVMWDAGIDSVEMPCEFVNAGKLKLLVVNPGADYEVPDEGTVSIPIAVRVGELVSNTWLFDFREAPEKRKRAKHAEPEPNPEDEKEGPKHPHPHKTHEHHNPKKRG